MKKLFCTAFLFLFVISAAALGADLSVSAGVNASFTVDNQDITLEDAIKMAEAGDAEVQYNLGYMYDTGDGVEQDGEKALYWYKKSAEQGFDKA